MPKKVNYAEIAKAHRALGGTLTATARRLGVHRGTVRNALRAQGARAPKAASAKATTPKSRPANPSDSGEHRVLEKASLFHPIWERQLKRLERAADKLVDSVGTVTVDMKRLDAIWDRIRQHLAEEPPRG